MASSISTDARQRFNKRVALLTGQSLPVWLWDREGRIRGDGQLRNRTSLELDVNPLLRAIMLCLAALDA